MKTSFLLKLSLTCDFFFRPAPNVFVTSLFRPNRNFYYRNCGIPQSNQLNVIKRDQIIAVGCQTQSNLNRMANSWVISDCVFNCVRLTFDWLDCSSIYVWLIVNYIWLLLRLRYWFNSVRLFLRQTRINQAICTAYLIPIPILILAAANAKLSRSKPIE